MSEQRESHVSTQAAADYLGVAAKTLEKWRWQGRGPAFVKAGARVVYSYTDLDAWLRSLRRTSTSDPGR